MVRGDARLGGSLYDRLLGGVDRTIVRLSGRREPDHDDRIGLTFERIVRALAASPIPEACSLAAWTSRVAAHVALEAMRARRGRAEETAPGVGDLHGDAPANDIDGGREAELALVCLRRALGEVEPGRADVVILHDALGHQLAEIAVLVGISVPAAQSRLSRGRRELSRRLELRSGACSGIAMSSERARALVHSLGELPVTPEDPTAAAARRRRVVDRVERAIVEAARERRRRARLRRPLTALALSGMILVALLVRAGVRAFDDDAAAHFVSSSGPVWARDAADQPLTLSGGRALGPGTVVRTEAEGHAALELHGGTHVDIAASSAVELAKRADRGEERLELRGGQLFVQIPKRSGAKPVRIETPDCTLFGDGAAMVVEVRESPAIRTRVRVTEGVVSVRHRGRETLVPAGAGWPDADTPAEPAPGDEDAKPAKPPG